MIYSEKEIMKLFGTNVKKYRIRLGLTQEKLAELEGKPAGKYFTDNQHAKGQELG